MEKIKRFIQSEMGKDILIVFIILLVGISSFYLGRLSNKPKSAENEGFLIQNNKSLTSNALNTLKPSQISPKEPLPELEEYKGVNLTGRQFFTSKRGKKYYPFGCSAGKGIKEENRIYFNTKEEAKSRGYTPSSSCK